MIPFPSLPPGMSGMSGVIGGQRDPYTQAFALSPNNAALDGEVQTINENLHYYGNTRIAFRARGSLVVLKGVFSQIPEFLARLYVNGEFVQDIPSAATDLTVWEGADTYTHIEIHPGEAGAALFYGPLEWVEITGVRPSVSYIPEIGRYVAPSDFYVLTHPPGESVESPLTANSRTYALNAAASGISAVFNATAPAPSKIGAWCNISTSTPATGYNSPVWGQIINLTSGASASVEREHVFRVDRDGVGTPKYGFARGATAEPSTPVNAGLLMLATGTSITVTPGADGDTGRAVDTYPDRFMELSGGRIKVLNMGHGGSALQAATPEFTYNTEHNVARLQTALGYGARAALWIGHLRNDIGNNDGDGNPKTPEGWATAAVNMVLAWKAAVPTLEKVYFAGIETVINDVTFDTWTPAQTSAVAQINSVHPGLAVHLPTDTGSPRFYNTVDVYDGLHPSTQGADEIAALFYPQIEADLLA